MLVSGGKILALSKVEKDETLVGLGTPDSPLGIKNPEQYAQKDWVEGTFVSGDYLEKNYWTSAATSAAVEARIRQIPGATEYSAGNGIKVENYIISLQESAFNLVKSWVEEQQYLQEEDLGPYATKEFVTSADGIIKTWIENNYWASSATSAEIARQLANFGGFEPVSTLPTSGDPKKIYLIKDTTAPQPDQYKEYIWNNNNWLCIGDTSMDLTPYAKTDWVSGELDKKVNTADFNSYKTEVEHALADKLDKDEFDTYSAGIATALGSKLDKDDFEAWSAHAFDDYAKTDDVDAKFSATSAWANNAFQPKGNYVTDEEFGTYQSEVEQEFANTSAWVENTFVSANEFDEYKNTVTEALAGKLGKSDFDTYSAGIDEDLGNISADLAKKLYTSATENWDVQEYTEGNGIKIKNHTISVSADYVTSAALDEKLDNYYTKAETWSSAAISNEFSSTSAWANDTFQPKGDYLTTDKADERYLPLSANLHNVVVTSQDESVTVNPTSADGIVTYDLSVPAPAAEVNISGENGVSAKYDVEASAWKIGLEEQTYEYLEAKETDTTTVTAAKQILNNFDQTTVVGSNISVVDGQITFGNTGLYHIDMQVDVTVANTDLSYYTVLLELANYNNPTIGETIKATTHEIDWSYTHTETINVSFDFKVTDAGRGAAVVISQLPLQDKAQVRVRNLNIHEVVTIDRVVDAALPTYSEGTAIAIQDSVEGKSIGVNVGLGLSADPMTNTLNVACGSGLKIDDQGGVMAVTLDEVTEQVVETVQQLEQDMETKITTNFPQAAITVVNSYVPGGTESQFQSNKGFVYGNLFNIAMNHKIEINKTHLGVYCKQNDNKNKYILGIYEYQPDYERLTPDGVVSGYGRTVAKCDTGFVEILPGFHEYPVKHLNNTIGTSSAETDETMSTNNFYYAAIFFPKDRNGEQGLWLGSAPGYNTQLNECKPQLLCSFNEIPASVNTSYSADLSFNDFGFTWAYDDYTQKTTYHQVASAHECYNSLRFFMQIRNHQ